MEFMLSISKLTELTPYESEGFFYVQKNLDRDHRGIMFDPSGSVVGQTLLVVRIHGNSPSKKIENKLK
jgi:hypothetical protein